MPPLIFAQQKRSLRHRFQWYRKRLRVMEPSELLYRIRQQQQVGLWGLKHQLGMNVLNCPNVTPDQSVFCTSSSPLLPELSWTLPSEVERKRLLNGQIGALSCEWNWSADPAIWHQAPDTKTMWPRRFFNSIHYRDGNPYGDIRIAWEPSRLQHLIPLALMAKNGPASLQCQAITAIETRFLSWHRGNPFPIGIHYISAMECGLRVLAICHTFDMARPALSNSSIIWASLLSMIHTHAHSISQRLSQHSSHGNHTVAEGAGLIYAGILFPEFSESTSWLSQGLSVLKESAQSQFFPDGGGIEQSFEYLRFITDIFGLVIQLLQHHQHGIPSSLIDACSRAATFLGAFEETSYELPSIGDSDTGHALSPYMQRPFVTTREFTGLKLFPHSGYSLISSSRKTLARLTFDHGPLGMPPSYGHGHADALSVTLSVGGKRILLDTGTFTYKGDSPWRTFFRGTSAHNTVVVDGMDQAIQDTSFLWSQPFQCRLIRDEQLPDGSTRLLAFHDGYESRAQVLHWRGIFYQPDNEWVVWDFLQGVGTHTLELLWHVGTSLTPQDQAFILDSQDRPLLLNVVGGTLTTHHGETNPISGWRSLSYGRKEPSNTIRATYTGLLPHEFITTIGSDQPSDPDALTHTLSLFRSWVHEAYTH